MSNYANLPTKIDGHILSFYVVIDERYAERPRHCPSRKQYYINGILSGEKNYVDINQDRW